MGLSIVSRIGNALPGGVASLSLPLCANRECHRPPTVWQRWWSRKQGIDLEGQWFCSAECLRTALLDRIERVTVSFGRVHSERRWMPLGLILFGQGLISEQQLRHALAHQRENAAGRIGDWLVRLGYVRPQDVVAALAIQQNCPVFTTMPSQEFPAKFRFPYFLARAYGGVPMHFNARSKSLLLAFATPVRQPLLGAAAHILKCQVEPCIVGEQCYGNALDRWENSLGGEAVCFEQRQSALEMSLSIASYAEQTQAEACLIARCEDHLWARLSGQVGSLDLLFRVKSEER